MAFSAGQKMRASHFGQLSTTARYQAASTQTITHNTGTVVAFGTALVTSSLVTRSTTGAGHLFTFGASGLWYVGTNIRWAALATGIREMWIDSGGTRLMSSAATGSSGSDANLFCSTCRWFNSGDSVSVRVYQFSGGNADITPNVGFGWNIVEFAYLLGEG